MFSFDGKDPVPCGRERGEGIGFVEFFGVFFQGPVFLLKKAGLRMGAQVPCIRE